MSTVVVGVDGSEESARALRWALEEAQLRGAQLVAVYAYDYSPSWQAYAYGEGALGAVPPVGDWEADQEAAQQRAQRLVERAVEAAGAQTDDVECVAVQDRRPAHALVEHSKHADLLVVGSRGRGGFAGLLLGSVSQQCVQHAACPVVVVPTRS